MLLEHRDVLAPLGREAAEAVEELERRNVTHRVERGIRLVGEPRPQPLARLAGARPRELRAERTLGIAKHRAGGGLQEFPRARRQRLAAQGEYAAAEFARGGSRRAVGGLLERVRQLGRGGGRLIQDHEIDRQTLAPPVRPRAHQLLHQFHTAAGLEAQQHDGQIPRYAARPEKRGTRFVRGEKRLRRAQRAVGIEHVPGNALK